MKLLRKIAVAPDELASPVHPRRFGLPGGVGATRGWYIWRSFDAKKWTAEVSHEATGEKFSVKVLPWATTYRHLVYGAHPDQLLRGERVNLFFAPDEKHKRGYLVHFQDELCQMKGHGHVWQVESIAANGLMLTARVLANGKSLDGRSWSFHLDNESRHWRGGKQIDKPSLRAGDQLYLTWSVQNDQKLVRLTTDDLSLEALKSATQHAVAKRLGNLGLGAFLEAVDGEILRVLVFPTYWAQAALWKEGQRLEIQAVDEQFLPVGAAIPGRLLTRKNLGAYGSGATEVSVHLQRPSDTPRMRVLLDRVVRVSNK